MLNGQKDLASATVMDGSALPGIDALPSCDAIGKAPRAAGYRGSDFVLWHYCDPFGISLGRAKSGGQSACERALSRRRIAPCGGAASVLWLTAGTGVISVAHIA